jgi:hypothetical protein
MTAVSVLMKDDDATCHKAIAEALPKAGLTLKSLAAAPRKKQEAEETCPGLRPRLFLSRMGELRDTHPSDRR